MWIRLYNKKSLKDKGTLYQLKNLINRTSVPDDPEKNMNATEDFMEIILEAHVVAAANKLMENGWDGTVTELASAVINQYVRILPEAKPTAHNDQVLNYACEVLSLGLLWLNYLDAVREGDGNRVMAMWKFLLIFFKKTGRRQYAKEAAIMLIQYHFLLSDRKAAELKYSRFVNTQGREGCNMPCDLFMEHLNRRLKGVIRHMGSNIQPPTLVKAARSIGLVDDICRAFEQETAAVKEDTGKHSKPSSSKDYQRILTQLIESKAFSAISGRKCAISLDHCLLDSFNKDEICEWLTERIIPCVIFK